MVASNYQNFLKQGGQSRDQNDSVHRVRTIRDRKSWYFVGCHAPRRNFRQISFINSLLVRYCIEQMQKKWQSCFAGNPKRGFPTVSCKFYNLQCNRIGLFPRHCWTGTISNRAMHINEPRHEISNNAVCATSKGSDQPVHMHRRLIRALASRLNIEWL